MDAPEPDPNLGLPVNPHTSAAFPWGCHRCPRVFTHARFLAKHVAFHHYADEPDTTPPGEYFDPPTAQPEEE